MRIGLTLSKECSAAMQQLQLDIDQKDQKLFNVFHKLSMILTKKEEGNFEETKSCSCCISAEVSH